MILTLTSGLAEDMKSMLDFRESMGFSCDVDKNHKKSPLTPENQAWISYLLPSHLSG